MPAECKCGCPADAEYSHVEQAVSNVESVVTDKFVFVDGCSYCGFTGIIDN